MGKRSDVNMYTPDNQALEKEFQERKYRNLDTMYIHPPYFLEREMIDMIKKGDNKNAQRLLVEINKRERAHLADDPIRSLKNSIICSCTLYARAAIESGSLPEEAFTLSDAYIIAVERAQSAEELEKLESDMLEGYCNMVRAVNHSKYSQVVIQTINHVNQSLTEKITLKQLADKVFVHPNYLSSLFKKEVGISLFEYILKRKVEESIYFIKFTDIPLADIANKFHFCSQSYYIKTFKKYLGVTPNWYRRPSR
jgi:YesN/AraC family two-component response regulator